MKLRPLDDRVVVEPIEAEETTAGGIVLPDTAKEKPQRGTVVSVGPGKLLESGHRGDVVGRRRRRSHLRQVFRHRNRSRTASDVKILRESDILAKVSAANIRSV